MNACGQSSGQPSCAICRVQSSESGLEGLIVPYLPPGNFERILIKPNWVRHQEMPRVSNSGIGDQQRADRGRGQGLPGEVLYCTGDHCWRCAAAKLQLGTSRSTSRD